MHVPPTGRMSLGVIDGPRLVQRSGKNTLFGEFDEAVWRRHRCRRFSRWHPVLNDDQIRSDRVNGPDGNSSAAPSYLTDLRAAIAAAASSA
jgi:hypothetical protein